MFFQLFILSGLLSIGLSSPLTKSDVIPVSGSSPLSSVSRERRSAARIIEDCMVVGLEEGTYFYKSRGGGDVCGVYLLSQPDEDVQVSFDYLNVDCESDGLVSFVDGWEMGGELFPGEVDAPLEGRVHEFCGRLKKKVFRSSGNSALIQYRVPSRGNSFKITVRYTKNPAPCNILVDDVQGIYTLRNHGKRQNCSITAIFPATVSLVQLSVGVSGGAPFRALETGVLSRCHKRGTQDYVEVGGGLGLDPSHMLVEDTICGLDTNPRVRPFHILCGMTTIRLVSSGRVDNSITVTLSQMTDPEVMPTLMCDLPL